jgi:RNA polymerase sigma-70 factor (ECF subfamily)
MVAFAHASDPADAALVGALQAREESALAELSARYRGVLIGVITKVTHDLTESEDILQEVLIQVWDRIESYDATRGKLSSWLTTVARRRAIDRIRQTCAYRRATDRFEIECQRAPSSAATDDGNEVAIADFRELIERILSLLPTFQREAVSLAYLDGRSQREIAVLTRTPLGTVKTRIELGMRKLFQSVGGLRDKIL